MEIQQWPDDVKRVADEMNLRAVAGSYGWAVFALADGKPLDHVSYPSWNEAVRAAKWDRDNYMFIEIQPDGMPMKEANAVLNYARTLHNMGYRIPSPDWEGGALASSMPRTASDRKRMARQLASGKPLYPSDVPYGNIIPSANMRGNN